MNEYGIVEARVEEDCDEGSCRRHLVGICELDAIEVDPATGAFRVLLGEDSAEQLLRSLEATVGRAVAERESARRQFERGAHRYEGPYGDCGYAPDDPKHPTYAERMADAGDLARKAHPSWDVPYDSSAPLEA